jgi:hypothetical protein
MCSFRRPVAATPPGVPSDPITIGIERFEETIYEICSDSDSTEAYEGALAN